uniref:Prenyl-dependent CAAX protease n=1 Tax=Solanum tuberosum TaxID=4113 RepID=M1AW49_SOLTU
MDGNKFLERPYITPITTPRKISGNILCTLKCAKAKAIELIRIEHHTGMYFVNEGRRNPLNTISSQRGAHTTSTNAYNAIATGSRANIDCSTLESVKGVEGRTGNRSRLNCDSRFTNGNMRHPRRTSNNQLPFRLNLNQSDGRGRKRDRQR